MTNHQDVSHTLEDAHHEGSRTATRQFTLRRRRGTIGAAMFLLATTSSAFTTPSPKVSLTTRRNAHHREASPAFANINTRSCGTSNSLLFPSSLESSGVSRGVPTGSPLEMICQDQHEFELQVGRAMDTLRDDYPYILTKDPNYSIYDSQIELVDPSGVRLHGVKNYKNFFRLLHAIVALIYCPERSGLTFRMCFDKARRNIRIHWNAQVIPKAIFGGYKTTLHADGISIYELDPASGNITQHRLERLVINDSLVSPEQGVFAALRGHAVESEVEGVPVFNFELGGGGGSSMNQNTIVQFIRSPSKKSVLFIDSEPDEDRRQAQVVSNTQLEAFSSSSAGDKDKGSPAASQSSTQLSASSGEAAASFVDPLSDLDRDALEKKNVARKKFGLKPLTPEEYMEFQKQVAELDSEQKKKAATVAAEMANQRKQEDPGFFGKLFENAVKNTCESNFDCSYPEVCCDFGFKKMCCSSGLRILDRPPQSRQGQYAEVPVPSTIPDYPLNDPRGRYY